MQTAATTNRLLTGCSSFKLLADSRLAIGQGGFYQEIAQELIRGAYSKRALNSLGDRLVALAHYSYTLRRMDAVGQVSQILMNWPLSHEHWSIGCFYQALSLKREGRFAEARFLFEHVADQVPKAFTGRVRMSLAGLVFDSGDFDSAFSLYVEAARAASHNSGQDWFITAHTQKMIAVLKSKDGDHPGALADLESLFPLVRAVRSLSAPSYYDYMNSLAVELCEVGRLEEAKNVSEIVLASPFAPAYPEWRETRQEIELKGRRASRSTVGLSHSVTQTVEGIGSDESSQAQRPSPVWAEVTADSVRVSHGTAEASNILRFPVREMAFASGLPRSLGDTSEPARVLVMSERNRTVGRDSNDTQAKKSYEDLDGRQLLLKIMELTAATDTTDYELLEILKSIESILFKQKDPSQR